MQMFLNSPFPIIVLYIQSILQGDEVEKNLQRILKKKPIRPSTTPCGSLIIIIPNKGRTWIIFIDYIDMKKLNLNNLYYFPRIDELLH